MIRLKVILSLGFLVLPGLARAQRYQVLQDWKYRPLRLEFWSDFEKDLKENKWTQAIQLIERQRRRTKDLERAEVDVAEILVLEKNNQSVIAFHRALGIVERNPGSMPALLALRVVDRLLQSEEYDIKGIQRLVNAGAFKEVPVEQLPMLAYMIVMENHNKQSQKWASFAATQLNESSYWGLLYKIQNFVQQLPELPTEEDLAKWQSLKNQAVPYPTLKTKMELQEARLLQSLKLYKQSLDVYDSLKPQGRELGRQMFERAWLLYNLKQYSASLGLLQSLKSSSMRMAIEPEAYVLAMLAYRDLCHYPAVHLIRKQFTDVFAPTLTAIKSGAGLEEIPVLEHMVAQVDPWSHLATEIGRLKEQRKTLGNEYLDSASLAMNLRQESLDLEKILISRIQLRTQAELKKQAERLVGLTEQMKLLEYVSDLEEFRLNIAPEDRSYIAEKPNATGSNGLFWAVDGEDWKDELGTYKVLVTDRCSQSRRSEGK